MFGTSAPYSHAPAAIRLSIGIVTLDPTVRISVLIHANNVSKAEEILATAPDAKERIKLWSVGEQVAHKDVVKSYTDMIGSSGAVYAQILQVRGGWSAARGCVEPRTRRGPSRACSSTT